MLIFRDNQVNTMATDVLAPRVAMFPVVVLLTLLGKWVLIIHTM